MKSYSRTPENGTWLDKLTQIVDTTPAGIVVYSPDGHAVFANPEAGRILRAPRLSLLGRLFNDPRWQAAKIGGTPFSDEDYCFSVAMRTGHSVHDVHRVVELPDGARAILLVNAAPLRGSSGDIEAVVESFLDVTQAKDEEVGQKRAQELSDALNDLCVTITSTLDFDEIVQKVVVSAAEALGAESCAVLTREADDWVVRYTDGRTQTAVGTRFTDDQAKACVAATRSDKPITIEDTYHNDLVNPEAMRQYEIRSMLIVPLVAQDQTFGTMCFQYYSVPTSFAEVEIDWAAKLGALLSLAFQNSQNYTRERQIAQELQEAQQMAHFGYWEWDVASNSTKWSDELYRLFGVKQATFDPDDFEALLHCIHPQDRERVVKVSEELRDGEWPFALEHRIIRQDGEVRWVHARGEAVFDEFNKPVSAWGTTQDITERKLDEIALIERDAKYRLLFENMVDGFAFHKIVVDEKGRPVDYIFLEINEAFEKLTGLKREEIIGKNVTEALPGIEQDPADWIGVYGKVALGGDAVRFEQYTKALDQWYSISVLSPMKDYFMCIFENITKRKEVEAALAGSEMKYRKLLEFANDAIFVAEAETGIIVEANQKAAELLGRPIEEIVGTHHSGVHPPDRVDEYIERFQQIADEAAGDTIELLVRHADGHDISAEISSSVIELDGKRFMKGIFRDLTARNKSKELSDKLNEVNSIINSTLKIDEVVDKVVSTSAAAIGADSAAFFLAEGDHWVLEQVHGPSPHEVGAKIPYDTLNPPPQMVENPAPVAISDACNDDRANKEIARKIGLRSLMLIPLVSDERVLGMLIFRYFTKNVEFTPEEIDFGTKLGASISLALENARLFSEQQAIASTLQESLLVVPEQLPNVEFGHLYRSASDAAMVGGDFYDLFALQGDRIAVVIGDVSGKGLEAAALTSTLKHMIKSYAYEGHSPGAIMSKTNAVIINETDSCTFVTVFVGILDTQSGILTYCCAGHPPPIIKRQNGDIDVLDTSGPPVGVLDYLAPVDSQQLIKTGDLITLYTDGVIEARCASDMFSEARLIDYLRNATGLSAADTPGRILDELTRCACALSDDLAMVSLSLDNS